ncbi:hypothetical protein [Microtetraspora malaysiensis]|uniref:hypothetical protein n=1 Tax=Microtetraspora malaysiensis TaxID=161358 RepID=UPI003D90D0DD
MLAIPRLTPTQQSTPLVAAAELLQINSLPLSGAPAPPVKSIGSYGWRGTTQRDLAGNPATIYSYTDPAGRQILVVTSTRPFPRPSRARDLAPAPSWIATIDGASLLCADKGGTVLAGGRRQREHRPGRRPRTRPELRPHRQAGDFAHGR